MYKQRKVSDVHFARLAAISFPGLVRIRVDVETFAVSKAYEALLQVCWQRWALWCA